MDVSGIGSCDRPDHTGCLGEMEKSLEISWSREGRLLDPYLAFPQGVSEPVRKFGEFFSSGLLVDLESVGIEVKCPVLDTGDVEASDSKVNPPYCTQRNFRVRMGG